MCNSEQNASNKKHVLTSLQKINVSANVNSSGKWSNLSKIEKIKKKIFIIKTTLKTIKNSEFFFNFFV